VDRLDEIIFFGDLGGAAWAAVAAFAGLIILVTVAGLVACLLAIRKGEDVEWEFRLRSLAIRWKITGNGGKRETG
jgi:hypothetical protein